MRLVIGTGIDIQLMLSVCSFERGTALKRRHFSQRLAKRGGGHLAFKMKIDINIDSSIQCAECSTVGWTLELCVSYAFLSVMDFGEGGGYIELRLEWRDAQVMLSIYHRTNHAHVL